MQSQPLTLVDDFRQPDALLELLEEAGLVPGDHMTTDITRLWMRDQNTVGTMFFCHTDALERARRTKRAKNRNAKTPKVLKTRGLEAYRAFTSGHFTARRVKITVYKHHIVLDFTKAELVAEKHSEIR